MFKVIQNIIQLIQPKPSINKTPNFHKSSKIQHIMSSSTAINQDTRTAKLIMVTSNNNNKYYEMKENSDGTFTVHYGRVGSRASVASYPISQWNKKYREKIRKGYTDQTHLFAKKESALSFEDIDDLNVRHLMDQLTNYANRSISHHYNVSAAQVTRQQVAEAQRILDNLIHRVNIKMDIQSFNQELIRLYQVIPRKMHQVKEHLMTTPKNQEDLKNIEEKLTEEQATLDVMHGQVEMNSEQEIANERNVHLLSAMGLAIKTVDNDSIIKKIKKMMGDEKKHFYRAFEVSNFKTENHFNQHTAQAKNKSTSLFWHGSRNENWLSILQSGLLLRPANAFINGKMFGYGIYFADKFRKSLNYTSLRGSYWTNGNQNQGFLAIYEVHTGKPLKIKHHQSWCYELNEQNLKKHGNQYDSLFAKGGADLINNEYIVYNQNQCTVKYLVEVR